MDLYRILFNKPENWFSTALVVASLILPGFVFIYSYKPDLFYDLNDFRLILLSVFYSVMMFLPFRVTYEITPLAKMEREFERSLPKVEIDLIDRKKNEGHQEAPEKNMKQRLDFGEFFASVGVFLAVFLAHLNPFETDEFYLYYYPTVLSMIFVGFLIHQLEKGSR